MQQTVQHTAAVVAGSAECDPLLESLALWLDDIPGCTYAGSPRDIVEQILGSTDAFAKAVINEEGFVDSLVLGLVHCVSSKGGDYDLGVIRHAPIDGVPQVEVFLLNL